PARTSTSSRAGPSISSPPRTKSVLSLTASRAPSSSGSVRRCARREDARRSIGDGVITTDNDGRVTYLNAVAESLTGWSIADAYGQPLGDVFRIVNESTRHSVESPASRARREGIVVGLANHTLLIAKDGTERPIDDSAAPIHNDTG